MINKPRALRPRLDRQNPRFVSRVSRHVEACSRVSRRSTLQAVHKCQGSSHQASRSSRFLRQPLTSFSLPPLVLPSGETAAPFLLLFLFLLLPYTSQAPRRTRRSIRVLDKSMLEDHVVSDDNVGLRHRSVFDRDEDRFGKAVAGAGCSVAAPALGP